MSLYTGGEPAQRATSPGERTFALIGSRGERGRAVDLSKSPSRRSKYFRDSTCETGDRGEDGPYGTYGCARL